MLIGLLGYARTGKDTMANAMLNFKKKSFAAPLKKEVQKMLQASKLDPDVDFNVDAYKVKYRPMLVAWGAIKRAEDPDYWIKLLSISPNTLSTEDIVITDVRYKNEVDWIKSMGGKVILVARPGYGPANAEEHRSFGEILEKGLKQIDHTIVNDSTIQDLKENTRILVKKLRGETPAVSSSL
jgi:phosphomevalonate kinase